MKQYYHDQFTDKSWRLLQDLKRRYDFILIGGWAVYLYTRALKSKDIDIVVSLEVLELLKKDFSFHKNERLRKFEIKEDEIDIDVYVEFFSRPGLPAEDLKKHVLVRAGFTVPRLEALLIMKQHAWKERHGSAKGEKDKVDILSLLEEGIDFSRYQEILKYYERADAANDLVILIKNTSSVPELGLNEHKFARIKKEWLSGLEIT